MFALSVAGLLMVGSSASAQDLAAGLSEAESEIQIATAEVQELEGSLSPAKANLFASSKRAEPFVAAAHAADRRVGEIEADQRKSRFAAAAKIARVEAANSDAESKHSKTVRSGLGFSFAALAVALIALAWGWFRASAGVAGLTRIKLSQAIGLCVGGGLLMLIVGSALGSAGGLVGVFGIALIFLGLMLPVALLLARHSAEIQRGRSKAVLHRERLPAWVPKSLAGLFGVLCLVALGTAVFAAEAQTEEVSTALRQEATAPLGGTLVLVNAEKRAARLDRGAATLLAVVHKDRLALRAAERRVGGAESRMVSAENDADSFSRRLAVLSAREARKAAAEEREAEKLAALEAKESEEAAAAECNRNYSGCLDPYASDYDCAGGSGDGPEYTGTVEVIGYDEYGLDEDGDGIGCDP